MGYAPWHCQASLGLDTGAVDTAGGEFMMRIKMKGHIPGNSANLTFLGMVKT